MTTALKRTLNSSQVRSSARCLPEQYFSFAQLERSFQQRAGSNSEGTKVEAIAPLINRYLGMIRLPIQLPGYRQRVDAKSCSYHLTRGRGNSYHRYCAGTRGAEFPHQLRLCN